VSPCQHFLVVEVFWGYRDLATAMDVERFDWW